MVNCKTSLTVGLSRWVGGQKWVDRSYAELAAIEGKFMSGITNAIANALHALLELFTWNQPKPVLQPIRSDEERIFRA